jgi:hypothetical protein
MQNITLKKVAEKAALRRLRQSCTNVLEKISNNEDVETIYRFIASDSSQI